METLVVILVACVVLLALSLLVFIAWREKTYREQIDDLTSKLIAKSLGEYSIVKQSERPVPKTEKPTKTTDPVLGGTF